MSVKTDRPGVRTAAELERKLGRTILDSEKALKLNENQITKVENELNEFTIETVEDLENIQDQLDGKIETYYFSGIPTLLNEPAVEWSIEEYKDHISDLYYDNNTGKSYRFTYSNGIYFWQELTNVPLQEALSIANSAKDTADSKRRVFTVEPYTPYSNGDLWINNKELYVCQISKETGNFEINDFVKATDYQTGTQATAMKNELISSIEVVSGRVTTVETNSYKKTEIQKILEGTYVDENGNKVVNQYIQNITGTFDDNGLTIEKTGAKTKSNLDTDGLTITDTTSANEKELFFSGYDTEEGRAIVRTDNISITNHTIFNNLVRVEQYETNKIGFFYVGN